ncbi:MAG: adenylyltransferase/cytidyltransferase family protein [Muribaculaceae bacterium]|nr:adenylyltransferase/cytidyltransferase family protein [Muribaculaceae bacterium]
MKTGIILARFQPIHNGHLQLISKAVKENDQVLVIIGSIDKLNARNPIPWTIRKEMVEEAIADTFLAQGNKEKITVVELPDLSDESDNSHDWGFYLYSSIVSQTKEPNFTIYYSDGFEIITSWFPGFLLRNNVSLSLLARNTCEEGISATEVREMILTGNSALQDCVPECVYEKRELIKAFLNIFKN